MQFLKRTLLPSVFITYSLLLLLPAMTAEAANPYGRNGWVDPIASIDGDDLTTCGADEIALTLEVRDRDTNSPITIASGIVAVFDTRTDPRTLDDSATGPGPRIGPVCYNPDYHSVAYDVNGGLSYYNFHASYVDENPGTMPRQKAATGVVWVTPTTEPYEYEQVYPSPYSVDIASSSPQYQYAIHHIHSMYGASSVVGANLFVVEFDPSLPGYIGPVVSTYVSQSGGVGTKTISPQVLADGWYGWTAYVHMNVDHGIGNGVTIQDVPKSGLLELWQPFVLDTTPPTVTSVTVSPLVPAANETVVFSVNASDALTGVTDLDVYVDGMLVGGCDYASVANATCDVVAGPFAAGAHESYAVARDTAGNTFTSNLTPFTVSAIVLPIPLSCAVPTSTVIDTVRAYSGTGYSGGLQAMERVGDYVYAGGSDGLDDTVGLYIYDVSDSANISQVAFFSTHNPASVRNNSWGNDVLGVTVEGGYAYLMTHYGGLVIVDVSDPLNPTFVGRLSLAGTGNEHWQAEIRGNYAFLASRSGLVVVNITDRSNPVLVRELGLGGGTPQDIVLDGNYAYIVRRSAGFSIVDISDPVNPVEVAEVTSNYYSSSPWTNGRWAYAIEKKGNYLYVGAHLAGGEEIDIFNVFVPTAPVFVGSVPVPNPSSYDSPRELNVIGDVLYVGGGRGGLFVFDVTDPGAPSELYRIPASNLYAGVKVWDVLPLDNSDFTQLVFVSGDTNHPLYTVGVACIPAPDLAAGVPTTGAVTVTQGELLTIESGNIQNAGDLIAGAHEVGNIEIDADNDAVAEYTISYGRQTATTPAGGSYVTSTVWAVPFDAPTSTTYRVRYLVDPLFEVEPSGSSTRANNISAWSAPFAVVAAAVPDPDLATSNVAPVGGSSFLTTDDIGFTGTVSNDLVAPITEGGWADLEIDWDSDGGPVPDGGSGFDDNYNAFAGMQLGGFSVGESKPLMYTILAGGAPVGTHRYRFNADTTDLLPESDESNNRSPWVSFTVSAPIGAPTVTLISNPTTVTLGAPVDLIWTVTGTADTCTASGGWSGSKTVTGDTESVVPSAAGTIVYNLECFNVGLSSGVVSAPVNVQAPDLSAGLPAAIAPTLVGDSIILSSSVENTGDASAGAYNIQFFIDQDGDGTADYPPVEIRETSNTLPSGTASESVTWTIPGAAPAGTWQVGYFADTDDEVREAGLDGPTENWSGWRSFTVSNPPSVTFNAGGCTIPTGGTSCDGNVFWQFENIPPPENYLVENTTTGTVIGTTQSSGGTIAMPLQHGPNTIVASANGGVSETRTAIAGCASDHLWFSGVCTPPPDIDLQGIPRYIRNGATTTVWINISSPNDLNCTLRGVSTTPISFDHFGTITPVAAYDFMSRPYFAKQLISISCTDTVTGLVGSNVSEIEVVPKLQEI